MWVDMRRFMTFASVLALAAATHLGSAPEASAQVTTPLPGVTLVQHGGRALAIADLCAPGVSIRATTYDERKNTPEGWANLPSVGADVAVNADFFDFPAATHVNGRARGKGQDWPAGTQWVEYTSLGEVRSYWQFGPHLAELVSPSTNAPAAGATEMVGAHNVIIRGGKSLAPDFDGDGVVLDAYRRTAIGASAAHDRVYLFSSNDALSGADMAATMLAYAAEGGAPQLDAASNEDGGGSAQMFVRGKGQIVTSGRLVANHLGILAKGTGPAPMCPNRAPNGKLDAADCTHVAGWAQDPDDPTKAIDVHLYVDGPAGAAGATGSDLGAAAISRPDLCTPLGTCTHAFDAPLPAAVYDGKPHELHLYAIDTGGGPNPELAGSPATVTCAPGSGPAGGSGGGGAGGDDAGPGVGGAPGDDALPSDDGGGCTTAPRGGDLPSLLALLGGAAVAALVARAARRRARRVV